MPQLVSLSVNVKGRGRHGEALNPPALVIQVEVLRVQLHVQVRFLVLAYTMVLCCFRNPPFKEVILIC